MPEFTKDGKRLISVVRVIEYHGTDDWINAVFEASRIPMQGEFKGKVPEGCSIKSGLVNWSILTEDGTEANNPKHTLIPIPPGSAIQ